MQKTAPADHIGENPCHPAQKCDNDRSTVRLWTGRLIFIMVINTLVFVGFQMIMPCLPLFLKELGANSRTVGLVSGVFTLTAVAFRPFAGRLLDTWSRKGVFFFGLIVTTLATIAYPLAGSVALVFFLRLLHGFGWSTVPTATGTIATDNIPKERMAEGMGYFGLTSVMAMAVAPMLALAIWGRWDFMTVCVVSAALGVSATLLMVPLKTHALPEKHAAKQTSLIERQAIFPALIMLHANLGYGAIVTYIAIYALENHIANVGLFFTVYAATLAVIRPLMGKSVDRRGHFFAVPPGLFCVAAGLVCLACAHDMSRFLIAGVLLGAGFGAVHPTLQSLAVKNVPPHRRGAAQSTFLCGFDIGIGAGAIIWGLVAEVIGIRLMYLSAVIPVAVAFVLYLLMCRLEKRTRNRDRV